MTSYNLHSLQAGPSEALLDLVEQQLLALTTASLDDESRPIQLVDEFATDFLLGAAEPPRGANAAAAAQHTPPRPGLS